MGLNETTATLILRNQKWIVDPLKNHGTGINPRIKVIFLIFLFKWISSLINV